jgi:nucleoside-diphosphate kinase
MNSQLRLERSLVLIKPDAIQRGLTGEIISRIERRGLKILATKMLQMDKTLAQRHYAVHKGKTFFDDLVDFITSSPIIAIVFQGKNSIEIVRQTMGETDPAKAKPGTIRGDFGVDISHNIIHGSDSVESALKEIKLFFSPEEIFDYRRDIDKWITGEDS